MSEQEKKDRQEHVKSLQTIADALNESLKRYKKDPSEENYKGLMDVSDDIWGEDKCEKCGTLNVRWQFDEKLQYHVLFCVECDQISGEPDQIHQSTYRKRFLRLLK